MGWIRLKNKQVYLYESALATRFHFFLRITVVSNFNFSSNKKQVYDFIH